MKMKTNRKRPLTSKITKRVVNLQECCIRDSPQPRCCCRSGRRRPRTGWRCCCRRLARGKRPPALCSASSARRRAAPSPPTRAASARRSTRWLRPNRSRILARGICRQTDSLEFWLHWFLFIGMVKPFESKVWVESLQYPTPISLTL